jgi:hypothetical protein
MPDIIGAVDVREQLAGKTSEDHIASQPDSQGGFSLRPERPGARASAAFVLLRALPLNPEGEGLTGLMAFPSAL